MIRSFALVAALLLASPAYAAPAAWKVDPAKSKIAFSGAGPQGPFTGSFGKWTADIKFSPKELPASSALVSITLDSAKVPDPTGTASLKEDDWFKIKLFPTATVLSEATTRFTGTMGPSAENLEIDEFPFEVGADAI